MTGRTDESRGERTTRPMCPNCGGGRFEWGVAQGRQTIKFKSAVRSTLLERLSIFGGVAIKARRCDRCGALQLFAND